RCIPTVHWISRLIATLQNASLSNANRPTVGVALASREFGSTRAVLVSSQPRWLDCESLTVGSYPSGLPVRAVLPDRSQPRRDASRAAKQCLHRALGPPCRPLIHES